MYEVSFPNVQCFCHSLNKDGLKKTPSSKDKCY